MSGKEQDNLARLRDRVKFDPTKQGRLSTKLFDEVLEDISEERADKAKGEARKLLEEAITLAEQMTKLSRDFEAQRKRLNKELGKVLNRVDSKLGRPVQSDAEGETSEETSDEGEGS